MLVGFRLGAAVSTGLARLCRADAETTPVAGIQFGPCLEGNAVLHTNLEKRKRPVLLASIAAQLALLSGAIAYGSSIGVSARSVNGQTSAPGFTLEHRAEPADLYPGGSGAATVRIRNAQSHSQHLGRLTAEVDEVEDAATTEREAEAGSKCWAGWFEITEIGGHAGTAHEFTEVIAGGSSVEEAVTVKMRELKENENGCQGKRVTMKYIVE